VGLRKGKRGRVHLGEQDENSNWSLRDNFTHYADQAKAAPGAARELLKTPGTIASGLRDMVADMRDETPDLAPDDPALAPIAGVDLDRAAAVDAAFAMRRLAPDDQAGRDAVVREHGLEPESWAEAAAGWRARRSEDLRVAEAHDAALRRHMKRLARGG
jgi:hypothetical protein